MRFVPYGKNGNTMTKDCKFSSVKQSGFFVVVVVVDVAVFVLMLFCSKLQNFCICSFYTIALQLYDFKCKLTTSFKVPRVKLNKPSKKKTIRAYKSFLG